MLIKWNSFNLLEPHFSLTNNLDLLLLEVSQKKWMLVVKQNLNNCWSSQRGKSCYKCLIRSKEEYLLTHASHYSNIRVMDQWVTSVIQWETWRHSTIILRSQRRRMEECTPTQFPTVLSTCRLNKVHPKISNRFRITIKNSLLLTIWLDLQN